MRFFQPLYGRHKIPRPGSAFFYLGIAETLFLIPRLTDNTIQSKSYALSIKIPTVFLYVLNVKS